MRIIAGRSRAAGCKAPAGAGVRPTSDRLRETLFNVLGAPVAGARVLDAFAGTGALGLEALSRGAAHVTFVDAIGARSACCDENVAACGVAECVCYHPRRFLGVRARRRGADGARSTRVCSIRRTTIAISTRVAAPRPRRSSRPGGLVVLEHSRRRDVARRGGPLRRTRVLAAGDSALSFYEPDRRRTDDADRTLWLHIPASPSTRARSIR